MPPLSVWLIRGALLSLLGGTGIGGWLLAGEPQAGAGHPALRDAHLTLMLFGWLVPFVLGTAYWILPRHPGREPRGSRAAARVAAGCYAAGVAVRLGGVLGAGTSWVSVGTALLLLGAAGFSMTCWTRIKPFGAGRASA